MWTGLGMIAISGLIAWPNVLTAMKKQNKN
jgi:hypothetical protein